MSPLLLAPVFARRLAIVALALALASGVGCGQALDDRLCDRPGCEFSSEEWGRLRALSGLPDPPADPSNKYANLAAAQILGQKFYFDPRFSGTATELDTLRRPTGIARAPKGQPTGISCATCHNPARAGADTTSVPGHVSVGAGSYDVNGQQTVNAAYYDLIYWNGRNDSLWAQILAVNESFVSMNSTRLQDAWVIADKYRVEYDAVFTDAALPLPGSSADVVALVEPFTSADSTTNPRGGQCKLGPGCPAACREVADSDPLKTGKGCFPRFPLRGKPGSKPGCQPGDPAEPFGDAWDCMDPPDQKVVTRAYVNFAKAIAAYESLLVSRDAPFDRFVAAGADAQVISDAARRGARLFVGRAACVGCHSGPLLTDAAFGNRGPGFHNVGVPQSGPSVPTEAECTAGSVCDCQAGKNCLPWGVWDGLSKLKANGFRRDSSWSDDATDASRKPHYLDPASGVTPAEDLKGTWRTPSLRDVALTAPYMHDGLFATLEEVVEHYDRGGAEGGFPGRKDVEIQPLALTPAEKRELVAFLGTLSGQPLAPALATTPVLP